MSSLEKCPFWGSLMSNEIVPKSTLFKRIGKDKVSLIGKLASIIRFL